MLTLADLLRLRARESPDHAAVVGLTQTLKVTRTLSYSELCRGARRRAGALRRRTPSGAPVLLLAERSEELLEGLFGCVFAARPAIPFQWPHPALQRSAVPRLRGILEDSGVRFAQCAEPLRRRIVEDPERAAFLRGITWLTPEDGAGKRPPGAGPEPGDAALIQYTSGTTRSPRGIVLTHRNILSNLAQIRERGGYHGGTRMVTWLPFHHDMGLIGGLLSPLMAGGTAYALSPTDFLKRPLCWLEAISAFRATTSVAPNFAYDLCAEKALGEDLRALDLSSWETAFNGAEMVRPATLDRFESRFRGAGFRAQAWVPCYGLAEATLLVSSARPGPPLRGRFDRAALEAGRAVPAPPSAPDAVELVGCGDVVGGVSALLTDREGGAPASEGRVGEICLRGDSIASRCWSRRPGGRGRVLTQRIAGSGRWLRTGDLGFLRQGQLFPCGRRDDVIVSRGEKFLAEDLEFFAESAHPLVRQGRCAAIALPGRSGGDEPALLFELPASRAGESGAVASAVRSALYERIGRDVAAVPVRSRALPRTTSGKIVRRACRALYLAGELRPPRTPPVSG